MSKHFYLKYSCALSVIFCAFAADCRAQSNPPHGRTRDGKPFRIDQQGMKISDYIAELEVANDDLKRQLDALEQELDEKDRVLNQNGSRSKSQVRERDLVTSSSDRTSCDARLKDAEARLATAEQKANTQLQSACDFQSPANPYKTQVIELQAKLQRAPGLSDVQSEQDRRAEAENELARSKAELAAARDRLASAEKDAQQRRETLLNEQVPVRAALKEAPVEAPPAKVSPPPATTPPDMNARTELRATLSQIQKLVGERKNLLDAMKSKGKAISISLRPLVTANGKSLDSFRLEVERLGENSDVSQIRSGLAEISLILNDDIAILRRLTH